MESGLRTPRLAACGDGALGRASGARESEVDDASGLDGDMPVDELVGGLGNDSMLMALRRSLLLRDGEGEEATVLTVGMTGDDVTERGMPVATERARGLLEASSGRSALRGFLMPVDCGNGGNGIAGGGCRFCCECLLRTCCSLCSCCTCNRTGTPPPTIPSNPFPCSPQSAILHTTRAIAVSINPHAAACSG